MRLRAALCFLGFHRRYRLEWMENGARCECVDCGRYYYKWLPR